MSMSNISHAFLDFFSSYSNNIKKTKISNKNKYTFKHFYNFINKNENKVKNDNTQIKNIQFLDNKQTIINKFTFLNESSIFLSKKIQNTIVRQMTSIKTFSVKIKNIMFTINIFLLNYENKDINNMKTKIVRLLYFLSNFIIDDKIKSLKINIILLDLKKELPMHNKVLDSYNVNTGLTWACSPHGQIIIYRKEEWCKVLIHELFHSLCFDFANLNINSKIKHKLSSLFFLKHCKFEISETYSEFWANIINSMLISYDITDNFNQFLKQFVIFHTIEKYFSIFQSIKVLHYMGLDYNTITSLDMSDKNLSIKRYAEKTNVFSYYILKMVWLFHLNETLDFFTNKHKNNIIYSNKDYKYLDNLIVYTSKVYDSKQLLLEIKKYTTLYYQMGMGLPNQLSTNHRLMRSLRMSVIEDNN